MAYGYSSMSSGPDRTLHSEKVIVGNRTYLFAIMENRSDQRFLCISKTSSNRIGNSRGRVIVPENHLQAFHEAYYRSTRYFDPLPKLYRLEELRERYPNAFRAWTREDDEVLATMFNSGAGVAELSATLQRQTGAILFRLLHLGLIPA